QPQFAADQAIAAAFSDQGENFGSEAVGFRPLSGLAAEALAARPRRGDAGADALLQQARPISISAPIAVTATAGATRPLSESSISIPLLAVVPVGMWAKASISPLSELAREAGESQPVGEADRPPSHRHGGSPLRISG